MAGRDLEAGGTWLALNRDGVVASILNGQNSLGFAPGKRSRGELPLEAVDHEDASTAATAMAQLEPTSYRSFNMIIADAREAFWLRSDGVEIESEPVPEGISMLTAFDLNDEIASDRVRYHLPRFRLAQIPNPDTNDWFAWEALLASTERENQIKYAGAMNIQTDFGFATVSSTLIALPNLKLFGTSPVWRFCPGEPGAVPFSNIGLNWM
tara:strand:- start:2541 stop:3170 length:630 start_codon:yes stop_codon:yes gene_type:complete